MAPKQHQIDVFSKITGLFFGKKYVIDFLDPKAPCVFVSLQIPPKANLKRQASAERARVTGTRKPPQKRISEVEIWPSRD